MSRVALCSLLGFVLSAVTVLASDVVVLTPENFDSVVDGSKHVFVKFYAPWCGHCKSLAPTWDAIATTFRKVDDLVIAKLDADEHKDLGQKFGVRGFPTLKFFSKGSTDPEDYDGGRSEDDFAEFLNDKTGSNVRIIKPPSFVAALTDSDFEREVFGAKKHALVEFYAPWCGHCKSLAPTYEEVGKIFAGESSVLIAKVDATVNKALAEKYGISGFPTIKYFAPGSTEPQDYARGRDKASFVDFMNDKAGTKRTESGGLEASAGRIKELDLIILDSGEIDASVVTKAEALVEGLDGTDAKKHGNLYIKAMKNIIQKGSEYTKKEIERLNRLLASDSVSPQKKTLFLLRKNILEAFLSEKLEDAE